MREPPDLRGRDIAEMRFAEEGIDRSTENLRCHAAVC
jgi:hypothetical protein